MTFHNQRLLVVTDGSPRDAAVLGTATQLLRPGGVITLLRVIPPPAEDGHRSDLLPAVDRAERAGLCSLRRQACVFASAETQTAVLVGADADAEIAAWLQTHPVDVIVIAARERRGLLRLWSERRAARLARLGQTPVITVHVAPEAFPPRRERLPAA